VKATLMIKKGVKITC